MENKLTYLLLHGSFDYKTDIEDFFVKALGCIVKDNIKKISKSKHADEVFAASNSKDFLKTINGGVNIKTEYLNTKKVFSFGKTVKNLINKYSWEKLFYIGAGAGPLLTTAEITNIASKIKSKENIIIANNFYSSDFFAFSPANAWNKVGARHGVPLPETDNPFAYKLKEAGNLQGVKVKPSCGTFLDIDSPVDLAVLSMHPGCGKNTREFLSQKWGQSRFIDKSTLTPFLNVTAKIKKALPYFYDPFLEVFIFGRVGSIVPNYIMTKAKCRFRLISEECGMKAWGRQEKGLVYSFLGELIEKEGIKKFFKNLSKNSKAAFIDTRVLFAHKKLNVSRADRFYSDLGVYEKVKTPFVKEFTYEAANADIPVILGGHSLISGGLYTLLSLESRVESQKKTSNWSKVESQKAKI